MSSLEHRSSETGPNSSSTTEMPRARPLFLSTLLFYSVVNGGYVVFE